MNTATTIGIFIMSIYGDLVDKNNKIGKEVSRTKISDMVIDSKHLPPKAEGMEDVPFDMDDPTTRQMVLQHAYNKQRNEQEHKIWLKQQEEWHRQMEEQSKRRREEEEQRREWKRKLPKIQFRNFLDGEIPKCNRCHSELRCIHPLVNEFTRLVNIIGVDKVLRLLGYTTDNNNNAAAKPTQQMPPQR